MKIKLKLLTPGTSLAVVPISSSLRDVSTAGQPPTQGVANRHLLRGPLSSVQVPPKIMSEIIHCVKQHFGGYDAFTKADSEFKDGPVYQRIRAISETPFTRDDLILGFKEVIAHLDKLKGLMMDVHANCMLQLDAIEALILKHGDDLPSSYGSSGSLDDDAITADVELLDDIASDAGAQQSGHKRDDAASKLDLKFSSESSFYQLSLDHYRLYVSSFLNLVGILGSTFHLFMSTGPEESQPNLRFDDIRVFSETILGDINELYDQMCSLEKFKRDFASPEYDDELFKQFIHASLQFCRYLSFYIAKNNADRSLNELFRSVATTFRKISMHPFASSSPTLSQDEGNVLSFLMDAFGVDEFGHRIPLVQHPYKDWFLEALDSFPPDSEFFARLEAMNIKYIWVSGNKDLQTQAVSRAEALLTHPNCDEMDKYDATCILLHGAAGRYIDKYSELNRPPKISNGAKTQLELDFIDISAELYSYTCQARDFISVMGGVAPTTRNFGDFFKVFLTTIGLITPLLAQLKRGTQDLAHIKRLYNFLDNMKEWAQVIRDLVTNQWVVAPVNFESGGQLTVLDPPQFAQFVFANHKQLVLLCLDFGKRSTQLTVKAAEREAQEARYQAMLADETEKYEARQKERADRQAIAIEEQQRLIRAEEVKLQESLEEERLKGFQIAVIEHPPELSDTQSRFQCFYQTAIYYLQRKDFQSALDTLNRCRTFLEVRELIDNPPADHLFAQAIVRMDDVKEPEISPFERCHVYIMLAEALQQVNRNWLVMSADSLRSVINARKILDNARHYFPTIIDVRERRVIQLNLEFFYFVVQDSFQRLTTEKEIREAELATNRRSYLKHMEKRKYTPSVKRPKSEWDPRSIRRDDLRKEINSMDQVVAELGECSRIARDIILLKIPAK